MTIKFIALLGLTLIVGAFGFLVLPHLLKIETITPDLLVLGFDAAMAVPAVATIWFLLSSLTAFKTATKVAYYIIAAGIFFYALTLLGQLFVVIFVVLFPDVAVNTAVTSLIFGIPFVLSTLSLYIGVRTLARQLSIRSLWMSIWLTMGVAVVVAFASIFIPHTPDPDHTAELITRIIFASVAWAGVFGVMATVGALQIKRTISSTYHGAMSWLATALGLMAFAIFHEIVVKDTELITTTYVAYAFSLWPFLLAGILFMKAGQTLKEATFKKLPENATYVDAVVYAAGLVSNPRDIDTTLDTLRQVTARTGPESEELSPTDKQSLLRVYRSIEDYLVTKEPLRKLTKPGLRARLTTEFQSELAKTEGHSPA